MTTDKLNQELWTNAGDFRKGSVVGWLKAKGKLAWRVSHTFHAVQQHTDYNPHSNTCHSGSNQPKAVSDGEHEPKLSLRIKIRAIDPPITRSVPGAQRLTHTQWRAYMMNCGSFSEYSSHYLIFVLFVILTTSSEYHCLDSVISCRQIEGEEPKAKWAQMILRVVYAMNWGSLNFIEGVRLTGAPDGEHLIVHLICPSYELFTPQLIHLSSKYICSLYWLKLKYQFRMWWTSSDGSSDPMQTKKEMEAKTGSICKLGISSHLTPYNNDPYSNVSAGLDPCNSEDSNVEPLALTYQLTYQPCLRQDAFIPEQPNGLHGIGNSGITMAVVRNARMMKHVHDELQEFWLLSKQNQIFSLFTGVKLQDGQPVW